MKEITGELYESIADAFVDAMDGKCEVSGTITNFEGWSLTCSVSIFREEDSITYIPRLVTFRMLDENDNEVLTDFNFNELKKYLPYE